MAEHGKWFKLWVGARRDSHLATLSKEDFATWCLLGMYLKEQGDEGVTIHKAPATALQSALEIYNYSELISVLKKFPNCVVGEEQKSSVANETNVTVTFLNWHKYQGDLSSERVRKFRARETPKRRGEETRQEEKRKRFIPPTPKEAQEFAQNRGFDLDGEKFVAHYAARGWQFKTGQPMKSWKATIITWQKNKFNTHGKPDWQ